LLAEVEGAPDEPDKTVRGAGAAFNQEADNIAQRVFGLSGLTEDYLCEVLLRFQNFVPIKRMSS